MGTGAYLSRLYMDPKHGAVELGRLRQAESQQLDAPEQVAALQHSDGAAACTCSAHMRSWTWPVHAVLLHGCHRHTLPSQSSDSPSTQSKHPYRHQASGQLATGAT